MATFAAIGIVGSLVGARLSTRVPQAQLRRGFAVFLIVMGLFILYKEAPTALGMQTAQAAPVDSAPPSLASNVAPSAQPGPQR